MVDRYQKRFANASLISIALLHHLVRHRDGSPGYTSVTNLDVHDLARLSYTFGLGPFFVVTPVTSQQVHVRRILAHWTEGFGARYNPHRRRAMETVRLAGTLADATADLTRLHGRPPILAGTASTKISDKIVDYAGLCDRMLTADRPVLLIFGTGWGLHADAAAQCDVFLEPIRGAGEYNHLSVRSAVTITIDRLLSAIEGVGYERDSSI